MLRIIIQIHGISYGAKKLFFFYSYLMNVALPEVLSESCHRSAVPREGSEEWARNRPVRPRLVVLYL